ncbi:MAG: acetyl-CoA carboxylase biotin carboxyl carrier protein [Phycisphaerales bacterium]|nr:acetyl-CoA carboxylase biotin carboxyl carrier protein [Phycisphaerales bacterium]
MIDIRKLKELVRLMVENELTELDLKDQEETVTIKRGGAGMPVMIAPQACAPPRAAGADEDAGGGQSADGADAAGLVAISSPMVGTFYAAANPDSPAFASVGTSVSPDSVVCLIEAMKVFNEIKAEVSGTVEKVLVQNGTAVEFGQKLFLVRPT